MGGVSVASAVNPFCIGWIEGTVGVVTEGSVDGYLSGMAVEII